MAPALELTAREQRVGLLVLERGELEPEEEELRVDRCALLGEPRDEGPTRGVVHVGREPQMRVVDRAREDRLDPLALLDRRAQIGGAQLRDASVVPLTKGRRCGLGLLDVLLDAWIVATRVEVGEVPHDLFRTCHFRRRHDARRYLSRGRRRSPTRAIIASSS